MSVYIIGAIIAVVAFCIVWEGLFAIFEWLIDRIKAAVQDTFYQWMP